MPRKRRGGARHARPGPSYSSRRREPKSRRDLALAIATGSLVLVIAFAGLAVDSGADASFDAPKRFFTLLGTAVGALALFGFGKWENPFAETRAKEARWAAVLLGGALGLATVSALVSPHRSLALDSLRVILLTVLLLPIGASRLVERRKGLLLGVFVGVVAVNAVVSILQSRRIYQPFPLLTRGAREATGAFVGNVGYLALAIALAAVAAIAVAALDGRLAARAAAVGASLILLGGLLVNQNLTALTALVAGVAVFALTRFRRRALAPLAAIVIVLAAAVVAYRPTRMRLTEAAGAVRRRDWDTALTYRLGAWLTALRMAQERPVVGFGPGTFAAEFVPHRLALEIPARRRYVNPLTTSTYAEAHSDYLQPLAEDGWLATALAIAAAVLLFRGLDRAAAPGRAESTEAILLLGLLSAGAAGALTWFPLQRPITAVPLLLAAGRAWRISRDAEASS